MMEILKKKRTNIYRVCTRLCKETQAKGPKATIAYRAYCTFQEKSGNDIIDNKMAAIVSQSKPVSLKH